MGSKEDIRQVGCRCQRILHSQAGMPVKVDKEERTPMNGFGCTRPIPPPRTVLESVNKISTEDLSEFISFPSSPLNL